VAAQPSFAESMIACAMWLVEGVLSAGSASVLDSASHHVRRRASPGPRSGRGGGRAVQVDDLSSPILTCAQAHEPSAFRHMAKPLTKSQVAAALAEKVGLTKKQGVLALEALAELAYKNAKNSFTLPGLGKLVLVNRKARMGRNPATGAEIKIPAKRVVKFRVAKAAKDAILGAKK